MASNGGLKTSSAAREGAGRSFELTAPKKFDSDAPLLEQTSYLMKLIHSDTLTVEDQDRIMREVIQTWTDHINPGFLKYRKSVADDFAAIEWRDGAPGSATLIDARGKKYIDLLCGFSIFNCGRSHPVIVEAVRAQLAKQALHSQELLDPLRAYCGAALAKTLPGDLQYAFFTNSGTESVEGALKFAILSTGRHHFVALLGAFHGKTLGSLSATSKSVFRAPFDRSLLSFSHVPPNDVAALRGIFASAKFTGKPIAGLILEPVLGEGGIHVLSDEFMRAARELCDESGACLIFDEVQCGLGRTGKWWACEHSGVAPDIMAIGKAFGGGVMPAGAVVGTPRVWEKYLENPFLFTTTFGGNPLAMTAAIAALHVIESEGLVKAAAEKGEWLLTRLRALQHAYPSILKEARGRGLMLGLEFHSDLIGYTFSRACFGRGVLLAGTLVNSRVIRVEPPLTITYEELNAALDVFREVLHAMASGAIPIISESTGTPSPIPTPKATPKATVQAGAGSGDSTSTVSDEDASEEDGEEDEFEDEEAAFDGDDDEDEEEERYASPPSAPSASFRSTTAAGVGASGASSARSNASSGSAMEALHLSASAATGSSTGGRVRAKL